MQNEILLTVSKNAAVIQDKRMVKLLYEASSVSSDSSFVAIDNAKDTLHIAKGIYSCLKGLGLLTIDVGEDIERIGLKIRDAKEEKRNKHIPTWRV